MILSKKTWNVYHGCEEYIQISKIMKYLGFHLMERFANEDDRIDEMSDVMERAK